jgi:diguanylate cyclase (GGDEF)-like protein
LSIYAYLEFYGAISGFDGLSEGKMRQTINRDAMRITPPATAHIEKSRIATLATLFVVLVCVLLVAITAWSAWNARQVQLRELNTATENMARSLAQQADDTFKIADTALLGLAERILNDGISPQALQRLQKYLILRVSQLPQLDGLFIFDKDGHWVVNSNGIVDASRSNADREYFIYHRTHPDLGPHIGLPVRSRSTGDWIIPLTRRLDDANGQFAGVVAASVRVKYFAAYYATYDIGKDGAILLALNNGIQLMRRPLLPDAIGKSLLQGPLFTLYKSGSTSGNAMIKSTQDGVERLNAYRELPHYPLLVAVALSKNEILDDWYETTLLHVLIVAATICVLGFLGSRLIGQIRLRVHAEQETLKAGEALRTLNQTLEKLALRDGLTGLANRRQFDLALKDELGRATRSGGSLALIMIDVDCFKQFNDLYGHLDGDECLRQVGKSLRIAERRTGDLAARYGGEEFAVLLPNTDLAGACKIAEEIRVAVRRLAILHARNAPGIVTISAGVKALMPATQGDTESSLISAADEALYSAKSAGRDQVRSAETADA